MKKIKNKINEKGITLIALIVTIIVLIILAAVTIYTLAGENNILNDAKTSKEVSRRAEAEEIMKLKLSNLYAHDYIKPKRTLDLQEIANALCDDEDIEYVIKKNKETASLEYIDVSDVKSIYTKLKAYPYEFEIGEKLNIVSVRNTEGEAGEGTNPGEEEPPQIELPAVGETPPSEGWTIEQAKGLVARDGLKAHMGEKVAYSPKSRGTWRIFYYDDDNYFESEGAVYLVRDFEAKLTFTPNTKDVGAEANETYYTHFRRLNPLFNGSEADKGEFAQNQNTRCAAGFLYPDYWKEDYLDEEIADYAFGSTTIEMFFKAYNAYYGNSFETSIMNKNGYNYKAYGGEVWHPENNLTRKRSGINQIESRLPIFST